MPKSRIRQEGELAGLMHSFFDNLIRVDPIQLDISEDNVEGYVNLLADLAKCLLIF